LDTFLRLDGEVDLIDRPEDLVDFANQDGVFRVDGGVEVGNLGIDRFADHLSFAGVQE